MTKNERRNIWILGITGSFCSFAAASIAFPVIYDQKTNQLPSLPAAKKDIGNAVCENKGKDSGLTRIIIEGQQYRFICGS